MIKFSIRAAVMLLSGLLVVAGAAGAAHADPQFDATACTLSGVTAELAPRLRCGTVAVPHDRANPGAGMFRLAVVVVRSGSEPVEPDPVVYVAGGPGSSLTASAAALAVHEAGVLAPNRDLILVDPRGAGRSEPLLCPALAEEHIGIFAAGEAQPALVAAWRKTYATCRLEMADDGIRPEWFGSQVAAEDVESVRRALGIARWNVYALSYGTAVATTLMALHPDSLRAVVLDSVLPPDPLPMSADQTFSHALEALFAVCRGDASCARTHPDLASHYAEAQRSLDGEPLRVPMAGPRPAAMVLRAPVLRFIVDRLLYARLGLAVLPSVIDAARNRDVARLQAVLSPVLRRYAASSLGALAAVACRERPSWREPDASGTPVDIHVPGMCADWSPPGPPPLVPKDSAVPSLLLAGGADPLTPPEFAAVAAGSLGAAATVVRFPHVGHGVAPATPCGEAIVSAFIRDPGRPVDATCADRVGPVSFQ